MIQVGEIIKLDDEKEYIVVNRMNLHNIRYVYLMTKNKPIEIMILTEKVENGEIILDEIKDNEELDYVLSKFTLEQDYQ